MSKFAAKPNQIKVGFNRSQQDTEYAWGAGCDKTDILVLKEALFHLTDLQGKTVVDQLKERGFDISTLKVSVEKTA